MAHLRNPDLMTPEERLTELASLFAKGFLRLTATCPPLPEEAGPDPCLQGPSDPEVRLDSLEYQSVHGRTSVTSWREGGEQ